MLNGKLCLVTGGSKGIGGAIAAAFAQEGASLLLVEHPKRADALRVTAARCLAAGAGTVELHTVDLTDPAATDALAADVLARHGMVDILVNGAAIFGAQDMSALSGDPDLYDKMMALTLTAPMRLTRRLAPKMSASMSGVIINISSLSGITTTAGFSAYAAARHGLHVWSHSCAMELQPYNVKVVCVQPGSTLSNMARGVADPNLEITLQDVINACMVAFRPSD